ncbi:MAG: SDR family NAD(P)-dependent oxidoreductase [Bacteroidales bacterium]|nr:MAG: SDR family NAD(P)-dependent oxidoreductase [Bacteroidales bacterium]
MISFKNRLILITGSTSGIGKALVIQLAKEGANLIIADRDEAELNATKVECLKYTSFCETITFDLSNPNEVSQAASTVLEKYGPIYLLINNGGISQRSLAHETPIEIDRKIMEIDFFSYIILSKAFIPSMIEQKEGYIAVTSSLSGKFGFHLRSSYSAAKHALQGYYETLRMELKQHGISVTIAYPGSINTSISINAIEKDGSKHGVMDPAQSNGMSAETCAKHYIRAIKKGKVEVLIGGKEFIMFHLKRFFPRLFFKLILKIKAT